MRGGRRAWLVGGAAALLAAAGTRSSLAVITVSGRSMAPGFVPGDRLLVRRRVRGVLRVGVVALLREPGPGIRAPRGRLRRSAGGQRARLSRHNLVIKRIAALPGDAVPRDVRDAVGGARVVPPGMLVVLGDNIAQSADSRQWGFMKADDVLGVVVRNLRRPADWPDGGLCEG